MKALQFSDHISVGHCYGTSRSLVNKLAETRPGWVRLSQTILYGTSPSSLLLIYSGYFNEKQMLISALSHHQSNGFWTTTTSHTATYCLAPILACIPQGLQKLEGIFEMNVLPVFGWAMSKAVSCWDDLVTWGSKRQEATHKICGIVHSNQYQQYTLINISPPFYCLLPILYDKSTMRKQIQRAAPIWRKLSKQLRSFSLSLSLSLSPSLSKSQNLAFVKIKHLLGKPATL